MNPAENNKCTTISRNASNLITTQRICGMDADSDHITGLDLLWIYGFKSLIDNYGIPIRLRRSGGKYVQPTGGDDTNAKGNIARINKVDTHETSPLDFVRQPIRAQEKRGCGYCPLSLCSPVLKKRTAESAAFTGSWRSCKAKP
jgi:hypothetical protein